MSLRQIADRTGINASRLSEIKLGKRAPSRAQLDELCDLIGRTKR